MLSSNIEELIHFFKLQGLEQFNELMVKLNLISFPSVHSGWMMLEVFDWLDTSFPHHLAWLSISSVLHS